MAEAFVANARVYRGVLANLRAELKALHDKPDAPRDQLRRLRNSIRTLESMLGEPPTDLTWVEERLRRRQGR